jgi:hypothetical protein
MSRLSSQRARGGGASAGVKPRSVEWLLLLGVCVFTLVAHMGLSARPPHRHQQIDVCAEREAEARRAGADAAVKHIRSQSTVRARLPSHGCHRSVVLRCRVCVGGRWKRTWVALEGQGF